MDGAEVAATKSGIPPSHVFGRPHFRDFLGSFVSPFRQHAAAVFRRHGLVVIFGLISGMVSRTIARDRVDASNVQECDECDNTDHDHPEYGAPR
jgi:hypothetical protein